MKLKLLTLSILMTASLLANAQFKVSTDGNLRMAYTSYHSFYLGIVDNGQWSFEHWDNGFNLWIPFNSYNTGNYKIVVKDSSGYVGIGLRYPQYRLDVNGDINTSGVYRTSSDARLKTNIKPLANCMTNLIKLNGKSYNKTLPKQSYDLSLAKGDSVKYNTILADMNKKPEVSSTQFGLIAQDVQTIFPDLVKQDASGYLSIDYMGLIPVIIEALKEQKSTIDTQSLKIKAQDSLIVSAIGQQSANINETNLSRTSANSITNDNTIAVLFDNVPNPFNQQTSIQYFIPVTSQSASLMIFDLQGKPVKTVAITKFGSNAIIINGNELSPGMFIYSLVVDGKIIDTKRMILTQ